MGIPKIPRRRLVNWIVCGFLWHQINGACAMEKRLLHALNADSFLIGADWFPMNALWRGEPEKLAKLLSNWCRRAGGRTTATGKNDLSFNRLSRFAMKNERNKCVCVFFSLGILAIGNTVSLHKHRFDLFNPSECCATTAFDVSTFWCFKYALYGRRRYRRARATAGNFWVLDQ